jgi:MFS family permease
MAFTVMCGVAFRHLTDSDSGSAYTIMNGVSGTLIDRVGTRLGYAACIAWWSTAAMLHAFARGALSLGLFRFLLGREKQVTGLRV